MTNVLFVLYMSGDSMKTVSGILRISLWRRPLELLWRLPLDLLWKPWRCQPREHRKSMRTPGRRRSWENLCQFAALVMMPLGGMAEGKDTADPLVAQVLRPDVAGTHPRVVDTSILVQSGLLVANPERPNEYWCPC